MLTTSQQDSERLAGTKGLWMLSFDATNRALIKAIPSAIETLHSLRSHPNKEIVKASSGVLWEIERSRDSASSGTELFLNKPLSHMFKLCMYTCTLMKNH